MNYFTFNCEKSTISKGIPQKRLEGIPHYDIIMTS